MTAMVQIEIPREVLHAARMTAADLRRELAIWALLARQLRKLK